jgi:cytochrome b561
MGFRNSDREWGSFSKLLHWTIALLIIGSSIFVLHVNDSTWWFKSTPLIFIQYINVHKTFGLLALLLILIRIWWRTRERVPVTDSLTPFEQKWSHRTHVALYVLMVAVPLTGWISSSLFGSPTKVFGWFTIPPITPKYKPALPVAYWTHFTLAWMILTLAAFHAGAALYHHFVRKDRVLKAMLPGRSRSDESDGAVADAGLTTQ